MAIQVKHVVLIFQQWKNGPKPRWANSPTKNAITDSPLILVSRAKPQTIFRKLKIKILKPFISVFKASSLIGIHLVCRQLIPQSNLNG